MKHEISPLLREFLRDWRFYVARCEENPDGEENHPYMNRIMGLCDNSASFMRFKAEGTERHPLSHDEAYLLSKELQGFFEEELHQGFVDSCTFPFDHDRVQYMTEEHTWKNPKRDAWVMEQLSETLLLEQLS